MKKVKIVAVVGSLRQESLNRQLALAAQELLGEKADFELLDYADLPLFNEDIEFPTPAAVSRVREQVNSADGVWFFTPEYNHFFPGVLKNLIDWLSRPISKQERKMALAGKPAAVSGISTGTSGTLLAQHHLVALISSLNMDVMNVPRLTIPGHLQQVDEHGKLTLTSSKRYLERQATAFINFIQKRLQQHE